MFPVTTHVVLERDWHVMLSCCWEILVLREKTRSDNKHLYKSVSIFGHKCQQLLSKREFHPSFRPFISTIDLSSTPFKEGTML